MNSNFFHFSKIELRTPISNISYHDAINAAYEFSNYLQKQKSVLDLKPNNLIVRLPSEDEWEFSARGGIAVNQSEFNQLLPSMKDGLEIKDYAWYQSNESAGGKVHQSGLLRPNPLGLYDMFGNVQEMMMEPYRAIVDGRLHGQSGGILLRGGGILSTKESISSALRLERKPRNDNGEENRAKDVGIRFVIGTVVNSSIEDFKKMNSQIEQKNSNSAEKDNPKIPSSKLAENCKKKDYISCRFQADRLLNTKVITATNKALKLYEEACDGDDFISCFLLGCIYNKGDLVIKDSARAQLLLAKACQNTIKEACSLLFQSISSDSKIDSFSDTTKHTFKKHKIFKDISIKIPGHWNILNENEILSIKNNVQTKFNTIDKSKEEELRTLFVAEEPEHKAKIRISIGDSIQRDISFFKGATLMDKENYCKKYVSRIKKIGVSVIKTELPYLTRINNHSVIVFEYIRGKEQKPTISETNVKMYIFDKGTESLWVTISHKLDSESLMLPIIENIFNSLSF
ncbi:SUMF1/EgtB/PvdO family nonheme iron enzyme [Succinivibrio dextrinosolvens]|uniref:SUMF1/EgtB/PvdO family nonheme iron enzyme n=1 Tax=Succinivibrio dextrinosolvens TaxID=83771 RepID=UPI00247AE066|nr:SUMF1/EgtB/PvdO family nonheme iron enzyme [Succinivibrio dextrinosolvens]